MSEYSELCNWLRARSSDTCRKSAEAAAAIECLSTAVSTLDEMNEKRSENLEAANLDYGLLKISYEHKETLLTSCEAALDGRDNKIEFLQQRNAELEAAIKLEIKKSGGNLRLEQALHTEGG